MSKHSHLYNNTPWRQRRAAQLQAEPLCRYCKQAGRLKPATVADHIEQHGGDMQKFMEGALQSLCRACHANVKQTLERSGYLKGSATSGTPLDPNHHWNK